MRKLALAGLISLALITTACSPPRSAGEAVVAAELTLDQVDSRYEAAKAFVALVLPFVSPARAEQIRTVEAKIEQLLVAARGAVTLAKQLEALHAADRAITALEATPPG